MTDLTNTIYTDAARQLVGRIDESIHEALDLRLGVGAWALDDLFGHLTTLHQNGVETVCLDGQPILRLYPVEVGWECTDGAYRVTLTRKVERL